MVKSKLLISWPVQIDRGFCRTNKVLSGANLLTATHDTRLDSLVLAFQTTKEWFMRRLIQLSMIFVFLFLSINIVSADNDQMPISLESVDPVCIDDFKVCMDLMRERHMICIHGHGVSPSEYSPKECAELHQMNVSTCLTEFNRCKMSDPIIN